MSEPKYLEEARKSYYDQHLRNQEEEEEKKKELEAACRCRPIKVNDNPIERCDCDTDCKDVLEKNQIGNIGYKNFYPLLPNRDENIENVIKAFTGMVSTVMHINTENGFDAIATSGFMDTLSKDDCFLNYGDLTDLDRLKIQSALLLITDEVSEANDSIRNKDMKGTDLSSIYDLMTTLYAADYKDGEPVQSLTLLKQCLHKFLYRATADDLSLTTTDGVDKAFAALYEKNVKGTFEEEVADIFIRTLHLAGMLNIDILLHVMLKLKYNSTREFKHGKNH